MIKGGRNNMALLTVLGLLAVPSIAAGVAIIQRWDVCGTAVPAATACLWRRCWLHSDTSSQWLIAAGLCIRTEVADVAVEGEVAVVVLTYCVPTVASCSFADDEASQEEAVLKVAGSDGFDSLRSEAYMVNGQMTQVNPWAANNVLDTRRYKIAQAKLKAAKEAAEDGNSSS